MPARSGTVARAIEEIYSASPQEAQSAAAIIRRTAHRLVGVAGFVRADRDDIEQELVLEAHRARRHFDPERGSAVAFISRITTNRSRDLITERRAQRRDHRLTEPYEEGVDARSAAWPSADEQLLKLDLHRHVGRLPPDLRNLCVGLAEQSTTEQARSTGQSRKAIYRHIAVVHRHFKRAGLDAYFGGTGTRWSAESVGDG